MKLKHLIFILAVIIATAGCNKKKPDKIANETSMEQPPLVSLCKEIACSARDSLPSDDIMKGTTRRIVKLMMETDSATTREALGILADGLKHDEKLLIKTDSLMRQYLNNPGSPVRNETLYIRYLEALLSTDSLREGMRSRSEERLRIASLNRPGTIATDFRYIERGGKQSSLHRFEAPKIILIFYDPECPHCTEILEGIASNSTINNAIREQRLGVLAIYAEGKRDVWEKTKHEMPANWKVGYDITGILDKELYDLPAMPLIYLLDGEHRVVAKDATI